MDSIMHFWLTEDVGNRFLSRSHYYYLSYTWPTLTPLLRHANEQTVHGGLGLDFVSYSARCQFFLWMAMIGCYSFLFWMPTFSGAMHTSLFSIILWLVGFSLKKFDICCPPTALADTVCVNMCVMKDCLFAIIITVKLVKNYEMSKWCLNEDC